MYRISLNGKYIGPWLSGKDANYWFGRLLDLMPGATITIVEVRDEA